MTSTGARDASRRQGDGAEHRVSGAASRRPRIRWKGIAFSIVALLFGLGLSPYVAGALVVSSPLHRVDAILSLGSHEWERLPLTARVAAAHTNAIVLLTVPRHVTEANCHDCAHRVARLRDLGVGERRIRVLPLATPGTFGEAKVALAYAREAGIQHLLVVTSPYHTRRALGVFRSVFDGTGIAIGIEPSSDDSPAQPSWWWLRPYDRWYVTYEWAAIVYYRWHYGIDTGPAI